jgi:hypothetical protein
MYENNDVRRKRNYVKERREHVLYEYILHIHAHKNDNDKTNTRLKPN